MAAAPFPVVLVIDDERGPRESLRILLKNKYQVLCSDSVDWGVELLQQNTPDAVIMDIRMPGKTGIDGLREIRAIDPNVSVIMLTGFGTLETAQDAIRLGANDYLKKPFDAMEMEEIIRRNVERTRIARRRANAEHEIEDLNHRLRDELANKEHFAEMGQKSAELVHDLRSPLTAVLGYSELLAQDLQTIQDRLGPHWDGACEYLEMIEKNVMKCKELTEMWLSLGRRDPQRMKPVRLDDLLVDIVKIIAPQADARGVSIDVHAEGPSCEIPADQLQIARAIQNVLMNAVDAVAEQKGRIRVSCGCTGEAAEIHVEDNGCGMDAEQLSRAFQPYFTTKHVNGTGLGLFITKKVIEDHRGTIELRSRPNEGTSVCIRLPALPRAEVATA